MAAQAETQTSLCRPKTSGDSQRLKAVALRAYGDQKRRSVTEQRITEMLPMVSKIANRVVSYLKPPLSFEDLVAAGTVGLVKAAKDYDASHQAQFKTYAYIRIRGAILDELKRWSFLSPEMSKNVSAAARAAADLRRRTGLEPSDEALAAELGVTTDRLNEIFAGARTRMFLSLDSDDENSYCPLQNLVCDGQGPPPEQIEKAELIKTLTEAIAGLPDKKRQTIVLYYQQHLTMKQIAQIMNITESRVSQLHASAIFSLSASLKEWKDAGQ